MTTQLSKSAPLQNSVMQEHEWIARQRSHLESLSFIVNAHLRRAIKNEKHPIIDFLFEYYHFKPAKLLDWSPGLGVHLAGKQALKFLERNCFQISDLGVSISPAGFPVKRLTGLEWVIDLLESTQQRKPAFGCFGLHEWCMVYEKPDIRHPYLALRLPHWQIREIVESSQVRCTHYDAFRFFSQTARKFNRQLLRRTDMRIREQSGCLHSNMDLYRWASKYHPWLASELIARTFLLAMNIRETDMRASPYDVSGYTQLPPIKIESRQGKEQYVSLQKKYCRQSAVLRSELVYELKLLRSALVSSKSAVANANTSRKWR